MSLIGTINLASNALAVQQAALQTTGNNISNAGNADYTRQVASTSPTPDQQYSNGVLIGTGVDLTSIQRQIDDALQQRINSATSDASGASTSQQYLTQIQNTFDALSGSDLSAQLGTFFGSWSSLANDPTNAGLRQVVVQNGESVASYINNLNTQFSSLQGTVNNSITSLAGNANDLANQIATLNGEIVTAQGGTVGSANGLLDQRDAAVKQLSALMDVKSVNQPNGTVDIYVGSQPLVTGTINNGVSVKQTTANNQIQTEVIFKNNNGNMQITSGQLGSLMNVQGEMTTVTGQLDTITNNLIFSLNKLHSSGQGTENFDSVTATNVVKDATVALNSTNSGLKFTPTTGSFVVHVTNKSTGLTTSTLVHIDENGTGTDTTLNSLASQLSGITDVSASINAGQLTIKSTNSADQISFSQDSSGTLAALGVNTFFTGSNSRDIAVNSTVANDPNLVSAAENGDSADNQTALAISQLSTTNLSGLQGQSITSAYQSMVNGVATKTAAATTNATATASVQSTLEAQRQSLSGVSLDEEAANLLKQQYAFQGAARVITTVNTMMTDLMALIP